MAGSWKEKTQMAISAPRVLSRQREVSSFKEKGSLSPFVHWARRELGPSVK